MTSVAMDQTVKTYSTTQIEYQLLLILKMGLLVFIGFIWMQFTEFY